MAYTSGNLHLPSSGAPGNLTYSYDAGSDTSATVSASGYFNNTDDELNLTVDDMIVAQCADGVVTLVVASISSGAVTTRPIDDSVSKSIATTGGDLDATGISDFSSTGVASYDLAAPFAGARKVLFKSAASTAAITVEAGSGITFDGTNNTATFDGGGECLNLVGLSATRWAIVNNTGSVALS